MKACSSCRLRTCIAAIAAIGLVTQWVDPRIRRTNDDIEEAARKNPGGLRRFGDWAKNIIDSWMLGIGEPRRL